MPLDFCHPEAPHKKLRIPEWYVSSLMLDRALDAIVRNLIESLERLRGDLDRMELWAAALDRFQHQIPDYQPADQHLLSPDPKRPKRQRPPPA